MLGFQPVCIAAVFILSTLNFSIRYSDVIMELLLVELAAVLHASTKCKTIETGDLG